MKKRIFSFMLALAMIFSVMSVASAATATRRCLQWLSSTLL